MSIPFIAADAGAATRPLAPVAVPPAGPAALSEPSVLLRCACEERPDVVRVAVARVTPALAAHLLEAHNPRNRAVRRRQVLALAGAISRGEWQVSGQGLTLNAASELEDGQHRLRAIVEAGVPVDVTVARGAEPGTHAVVDLGLRRTAGDALSLDGHEDGQLLAGALDLLAGGSPAGPAPVGSSHPRSASDCSRTTLGCRTRSPRRAQLRGTPVPGKVPAPAFAVERYRMGALDPQWTGWLFAALRTGQELSATSPVRLLREHLLTAPPGSWTTPVRRGRHALLVKGWNAAVTGREVRRYRFAANEPFPKRAAPTRPALLRART